MRKSLSEELLDYLKENIDKMYESCLKETQCKTVVEDSVTHRRWAFVGSGCGITYLKYRKSKAAEEIDNAAHKYHYNEVLEMLIKKLPKEDYDYLKSIGCPFEAIWSQMQNLQIVYYNYVVAFAKTKGIKLDIVSHLD